MKVCPSCQGRRLADEKKYCRQCGAQLVPVQALEPVVMAKLQRFDIQLEQAPNDMTVVGEYAAFLRSQSMWSEALSLLLKPLKESPSNESLRFQLFEVYEAKKDWTHAITQLLILQEQNPGNRLYTQKLVSIYQQRGQYPEAAKVLKTMSELEPDELGPLKQRIELSKKGSREDIITLCKELLHVEPQNEDTLLLLAQSQLKSKRMQGATSTFESLLALQPENAQANLYVGIKQYNASLWVEAVQLLTTSLEHTEQLSSKELALAQLYLFGAKLHLCTVELSDIDLSSLQQWSQVGKTHHPVLHQCYVLLARLQWENGEEDEAIVAYKQSLCYQDNQEVRLYLSRWYGVEGDRFVTRKRYKRALLAYEEGLQFQPLSSELAEKYNSTKQLKRRNTILFSVGTVGVLLVVAGLLALNFYARGVLSIQTIPSATIKVYSGKHVVAQESTDTSKLASNLRTTFLRSGSYTVHVHRKGFHTIRKELKVGLGRNIHHSKLHLVPKEGSLRVTTSPTGATVVVRNSYATKTCQTPCDMRNLFAVSSSIRISLPGYTAYTLRASIPVEKTLNLGKISFVGSLQIKSTPSGATVLLNNRRKGITPIKIDNVPARFVKVVVRKKGVRDYKVNTRILPEETTYLDVKLPRVPPSWVRRLVERWRRAWERTARIASVRVLRGYYHRHFYHINGKMNKTAYMNRLRWGAKKFRWYRIRVRNLQLSQRSSTRFTVKFRQYYSRPGASDEGTKTLVWKKSGNQWRIYREKWVSLGRK